ncbi:hypothetical protein ACO2Q8_27025 [Larkinella sp. VNQ87]
MNGPLFRLEKIATCPIWKEDFNDGFFHLKDHRILLASGEFLVR